MSDRYPHGSLQRRSSRAVEARRPGALERKTAAVYDTVTDGMVGWEFVRTRRWFVYIVAALVFAVACVFLSHWQLDRGKEAAAYNARVQSNFYSAPVALDSVLPTLGAYSSADDWKRVSLTGSYVAKDQLFVRTRPCGDNIGFEVLTPLQLADGSRFMIDRGCVDAGSNQNLPSSEPTPPHGTVHVVARIEPSEAARGSRPAVKNQIESIDLAQVKQRMGGRVYTGAYGLLDYETPAAGHPLGAVVTGPPTVGTALHWSYMVQWILFAVIGFGGLFYGMRGEFRRINADDPEERERARKRRQKAARKKFTDAEIEDELLDGFIPMSRWGIEGTVALAHPGSGPRGAISGTAAAVSGDGSSTPAKPQRPYPEVIVIQPRDTDDGPADEERADDTAEDASPGSDAP